MGRAGCEDSATGVLQIAARVDFQYIPPRLVEPSKKNDLTTRNDAFKSLREIRIKFQPRIALLPAPGAGNLHVA